MMNEIITWDLYKQQINTHVYFLMVIQMESSTNPWDLSLGFCLISLVLEQKKGDLSRHFGCRNWSKFNNDVTGDI